MVVFLKFRFKFLEIFNDERFFLEFFRKKIILLGIVFQKDIFQVCQVIFFFNEYLLKLTEYFLFFVCSYRYVSIIYYILFFLRDNLIKIRVVGVFWKIISILMKIVQFIKFYLNYFYIFIVIIFIYLYQLELIICNNL